MSGATRTPATAPTGRAARRTQRLTELVLPVVLAGVVLGPALGPGFSLSYDMVFVPRLPFTARLLGLDGSVPRAVPSDAVVAVLSRALPAELLQKLILLAILVAGGSGAARMMRRHGGVAAAAAAVLYVWNPYVGSRLLLGQWAILVAYAVLPWLVRCAATLGPGDRRQGARLLLLLALASLSPSGGLIAGATACAVVALGPRATGARARATALVLVATLLVNLPWVLPALLRQGGLPGDPGAADAFAARSDTSLGTVLSVLTLGGTWNSQTTPAGRDGFVAALLLLVLLGLSGFGVLLLRRGPDVEPWVRGLVVVSAVALVVALAGSLPGLRTVLRWLVADVPGGGLLRDGTRYLVPWVLLAALGLGRAVAELGRRLRMSSVAALLPVAATLVLLLPVSVLVGLAWGGFGQLGTARYPSGWAAARELVAAEPDSGLVVLLPWGSYRQFPWNDRRTLYDPANRWLPARTVADDRLAVGDQVVAGEDPLARALTPLVESSAPLAPGLAAHGVGWVLLERTTPGGDSFGDERFAGLTLRLDTPELRLWQVPGALPAPSRIRGAALVQVVDVGVLLVLLGGIVAAVPMSRTRRPSAR